MMHMQGLELNLMGVDYSFVLIYNALNEHIESES